MRIDTQNKLAVQDAVADELENIAAELRAGSVKAIIFGALYADDSPAAGGAEIQVCGSPIDILALLIALRAQVAECVDEGAE